MSLTTSDYINFGVLFKRQLQKMEINLITIVISLTEDVRNKCVMMFVFACTRMGKTQDKHTEPLVDWEQRKETAFQRCFDRGEKGEKSFRIQ